MSIVNAITNARSRHTPRPGQQIICANCGVSTLDRNACATCGSERGWELKKVISFDEMVERRRSREADEDRKAAV
jgi:hypothetical protein